MSTVIQVLDKGFVRLEGQLGGDAAVIRAARVSYNSEPRQPDADKKLIAYLLKHNHGTPFEHAVYTFHIKLPIFAARQWIRHRMSSYNETSFRYREAPEEFYIPERWRGQDIKNKQGSVPFDVQVLDSECNKTLIAQQESAMAAYRAMLKAGIAREMARMVLPVNLYTEWYWTVNARALMHFIGLRSESHAQLEIRQYSHALASIFAETMPWTYEAFLANLPADGYGELREGTKKCEEATTTGQTKSPSSLGTAVSS